MKTCAWTEDHWSDVNAQMLYQQVLVLRQMPMNNATGITEAESARADWRVVQGWTGGGHSPRSPAPVRGMWRSFAGDVRRTQPHRSCRALAHPDIEHFTQTVPLAKWAAFGRGCEAFRTPTSQCRPGTTVPAS